MNDKDERRKTKEESDSSFILDASHRTRPRLDRAPGPCTEPGVFLGEGSPSSDARQIQSPPLDWRSVAAAVAHQRIGHRFVYLDTTASTNDVARALGETGEGEGVVVFAETQLAGRGRAGKGPWLTPPRTSVALSVLLRPSLPPERLPLLAMAAAVAGVEAIRRSTGVPAAIKWPNDLVIGDRKAGGILVESTIAGGLVAAAVAGIGINGNLPAAALGALPDAVLPPTTLLDEAGRPISREALVIALLQALERAMTGLASGAQGAADLQRRYSKYLCWRGRWVRVEGAGSSPVEGVAEDVDDIGALRLRLPSGERRSFAYGELSLRMAGPRDS